MQAIESQRAVRVARTAWVTMLICAMVIFVGTWTMNLGLEWVWPAVLLSAVLTPVSFGVSVGCWLLSVNISDPAFRRNAITGAVLGLAIMVALLIVFLESGTLGNEYYNVFPDAI